MRPLALAFPASPPPSLSSNKRRCPTPVQANTVQLFLAFGQGCVTLVGTIGLATGGTRARGFNFAWTWSEAVCCQRRVSSPDLARATGATAGFEEGPVSNGGEDGSLLVRESAGHSMLPWGAGPGTSIPPKRANPRPFKPTACHYCSRKRRGHAPALHQIRKAVSYSPQVKRRETLIPTPVECSVVGDSGPSGTGPSGTCCLRR